MRISTSTHMDTITLTLCGRLDYGARQVFRSTLEECDTSIKHQLILDLEAVTFIDSAGLGLLFRCISEFTEKHVTVSLVNPNYQIHDLLELCNMSQYISTPASTLS